MNSLWPAARLSCRTTSHAKFRTSVTIDNLVARLVQGAAPIRPYSIFSVPFRRKESKGDFTPLPNCKQLYNGWAGGLGLSCSKRFYARKQNPKPKASSKKGVRILTKYEELPDNYDDDSGLSYREEPVTREEAETIFGHALLNANEADHFMRVLHGRRVAGTLPDIEELNELANWEKVTQIKAIEWLRLVVQIDEEYNALRRVELELEALERKDIGPHSMESLGYMGPKIHLRASYDNTADGQKKSVYGDSRLDYIRQKEKERLDMLEEKAKKAEAEALAQAEARVKAGEKTGTLQTTRIGSKVELRRPGENPKFQKYLARSHVLPDVPPDMTIFQRLWPSGLFVLLTLGAITIFTSFYTPPAQSARLFPEVPPAFATIMALIAANSLVCLLWHMPPAWRMLNKYFIVIPGYPRALSMLGAVFSHQAIGHLASCMFVLYFVGTRLYDEIGRANFLAVFFGTGVVSSFVSLTSWVIRGSFPHSSLGASGAMCGIVATYLWLRPSDEVRLFGVVPPPSMPGVPAWVMLAGFLAVEVLGMRRAGLKIKLDYWAHIGGLGSGVVAAEILKWRERERRKKMGILERSKERLKDLTR